MPTTQQAQLNNWYVSSTGNHQGLVIDEVTGANIAVTYDKAHAPLVAAAPALLAALKAIAVQLRTHPHFEQGSSKVHYCVHKALSAIAQAEEVPHA